jgi:hypothetical protein
LEAVAADAYRDDAVRSIAVAFDWNEREALGLPVLEGVMVLGHL